MRKFRWIEIGVPWVLVVYFGLAYAPVVTRGWVKKAPYPCTTFNLYSTIEQAFVRYDILLDGGQEKERYLLYNNTAIHRLERNYYQGQLSKLKVEWRSGAVDSGDYPWLSALGETAELVEFRASDPEAVRTNQWEVRPLVKLR